MSLSKFARFLTFSLICGSAMARQPSLQLSIDSTATPKRIGERINIYVSQTSLSKEVLRIEPFPYLSCPISVLDSHNVPVPFVEQQGQSVFEVQSNFDVQFGGRPGPVLGPNDVYKFIFDLSSHVRIAKPGIYSVQFRVSDPRGGQKACISSNIIHLKVL